MKELERIQEALAEGLDDEVPEMVRQALDQGLAPGEVLNKGLVEGMGIVGERFRNHDIFLPDVLLAARAMHAGLEILEPLLGGGAASRRGTVVLGTVQGDLHDIGKNLVGILLKGAGYDVMDLGTDVTPERFVEAARTSSARVVGLSALLTTTMPAMARVVTALREAGLEDVKVLVGGAPVSEAYAKEIGAHAYGYDAARAVELVKEVLS